MKLDQALDEIRSGAGSQFDPDVATAFLDLVHEGALLDGSPAAPLAAAV
jgi:HD-GYP domain-containing protein (c-di-GMP phosphodiesterase class II)